MLEEKLLENINLCTVPIVTWLCLCLLFFFNSVPFFKHCFGFVCFYVLVASVFYCAHRFQTVYGYHNRTFVFSYRIIAWQPSVWDLEIQNVFRFNTDRISLKLNNSHS